MISDEILSAVKIITVAVQLNCFLVAMYIACCICDFFFALFKPGWKSSFGLRSRKGDDKFEN